MPQVTPFGPNAPRFRPAFPAACPGHLSRPPVPARRASGVGDAGASGNPSARTAGTGVSFLNVLICGICEICGRSPLEADQPNRPAEMNMENYETKLILSSLGKIGERWRPNPNI